MAPAATNNVTPRSKKPGRFVRPTRQTPITAPLFGAAQNASKARPQRTTGEHGRGYSRRVQ